MNTYIFNIKKGIIEIKQFPFPVVGRLKQLAKKLKLPMNKIEQIQMKDTNVIANIQFPFSFKNVKKDDPAILQKFEELRSKYKDYIEIYTDGSVDENRTGCAFITNNATCKYRLPKNCSILTAEVYAIYRSILYIKNHQHSKFVIFIDSQSAINFIKNNKNKHAMQIRVHKLINKIKNKTIIFEWIPSHRGIKGNELADTAARDAIKDNYIVRLPLNTDEFSCMIKKKIEQLWQKQWNHRKYRMYRLKPRLGDWKSSYRKNRQEEVILSRMRTETCLYMVQHFFTGEPSQNRCDQCQVTNTLQHLVIDCPLWNIYRSRLVRYCTNHRVEFSIDNILGDNFDHNILFTFLKDIKFVGKI